MQRAEIFFEFRWSKSSTRQAFRCAAFQRNRKVSTREPPACSVGLRVQPLEQGGANLKRLHRVHGIRVNRPAFWIFGHVYFQVFTVSQETQPQGIMLRLLHLRISPRKETCVQNEDATQREFRVSYLSVAHPARNENCLAGLEVGALRCARGSISDFATLVRKSYSGSPSLVSTLVLVEHFLFCWRTWEH